MVDKESRSGADFGNRSHPAQAAASAQQICSIWIDPCVPISSVQPNPERPLRYHRGGTQFEEEKTDTDTAMFGTKQTDDQQIQTQTGTEAATATATHGPTRWGR